MLLVARQRGKFFKNNLKYGIIFALFTTCGVVPVSAEPKQARLAAAIEALVEPQQLDSTAICVRDLKRNRDLFTLNCANPLKPASVMKLATTSATLAQLGSDFTWKTKVFISEIKAGKARSVAVQGVGDPSITTESLWLLARKIRKAGVESVDSLVLDSGAFLDQKSRSGSRAYEGGSSSLAFNFNSIGFEICPTEVGKPARVASDPWEAGQKITSSVRTTKNQGDAVEVADVSTCGDQSCQYAYGLSGTIAVDSTCIQVYRSVEHPEQYFAETLQQFLRQLGVRGKIEILYRKAGSDSNLSIVHASKSLKEVLFGLNNFSTNVTADQLVYALGDRAGEGLSFIRGLQQIGEHLAALGIPQSQFVLKDGSGLSHENRLSGGAIIRILDSAYREITYGVDFQSSLSVWGKSGTLKSRRSLPGAVAIRGKTGSLDGVSSLAGYLYRDDGEVLAFSILQNRVASKAKAVDIEDEVIEYLSTL